MARSKTGGGPGSNQYRVRGTAKQRQNAPQMSTGMTSPQAALRGLDIGQRSILARDPSTPPEILTLLAQDKDIHVRHEVARNSSAPPELLAQLAQDENMWVRWRVVKNLKCPPEILLQLIEDSVKGVQAGAIETIMERSDIPDHIRAIAALSQ